MIFEEDEALGFIEHYGILRRSGRYPWGSGGTQDQRNKMFIDFVADLRRDGMSEVDIARGFGISTTELRAAKSVAKNQQRAAKIAQATRLQSTGMSTTAIGKEMGINESSVRDLLRSDAKDKADVLRLTSEMLKRQVDEKGYIDVGSGVEAHLGISRTKLKTAVAMLKEEGYLISYVPIPQIGTGQKTTQVVLSAPGTAWKDVWANRYNVRQIQEFSNDRGRTMLGIQEPISISSKRIKVNYKEDGGAEADGVIYVRPGVKDLSLGGARYAQVRIAVDKSHYLKGMAVLKDDLPDGVDLVFNTNKSDTGNKLDAMKGLKDDPDNPFGSVVRQLMNDKGKVSSAMNIVYAEGDWETWSKSLSSQFLSKQTPQLIKSQLNETFRDRQAQLDEIMKLTNPAVRRKLLQDFSDDSDAAAVHLKAAALPRQASHVILPIKDLKESEIYAPNFKNGERVVLVRHPHGGIFEIPELTVNNNHAGAKKIMANAPDAVGINHKVAERLSGADFDGDTVIVIPNGGNKVKTSPALLGLKNFDPQAAYPAYEGMPRMSAKTKQFEMGDISNLITDMTIKGANQAELAAAVRHSMVVIDAEKHNLNWKQSAQDNGIANLKRKYQKGPRAGADTLISKASSPARIPEIKPRSAKNGGPIDRETGRLVFEPTGESWVGKDGKTHFKTTTVTKLGNTHDAHTLSSGTPKEEIYADHSNRLKALANQARLEMVGTKSIPYSPSAKKVYAKEVADLNAKLNIAQRNRPLERQAQLLANAVVTAKRQANPDMDAETIKKVQYQALAEMRARTGAGKQLIKITESEWAAIQAGAITNHKLTEILNSSDMEIVKKLATPRQPTVMTASKQRRAKALLDSGATQAEVAEALGVALSTLKSSLSEGS